MKARLRVSAGPLTDTVYFLTNDNTQIGRDPSNSLSISDLSLSRRHCVLRRDRDSFRICDLDSCNGTFVNGSTVSEKQLHHGDRISIGDSILVFLEKDDQQDESRAAAEFDGTVATVSMPIDSADVLYLRPERILEGLPSTSRAERNLHALVRVGMLVHSISDLNHLQEQILALIFEFVPAERGAILLDSTDNEKFSSLFVYPGRSQQGQPVRVSRTITRQVMEQGVAVLARNVPDNAGLRGMESLVASQVRSLLCVPLTVFQKVIGCIYLDTTSSAVHIGRDHLELVAGIAGIAAVALENSRRLLWLEQENLRLAAEINLQHNMVGESKPMKEVYRFLSRVAPTDATVLIGGESGTGKELVARAIHRNSPRAARPFVAINCAAIPEGLLESELFGYERGAFTGAHGQKKGRLEMASGGVVFLDEIGELAPSLQVKLLRVLQEREFERLGGSRPVSVDIRLIAATNKNLAKAVKAGTFRVDLYYRLNVVSLVVPPLRERPEDIPILAQYFISKCAVKCKVKPKKFSRGAMSRLVTYAWPGNVRELENAIERSLLLTASDVIGPDDLPESVLEKDSAHEVQEAKYHLAVKQLKRHLILTAIEESGGNYTEAARILGVHANYLHRLVRNLNLRTPIRSLSIPSNGFARTSDHRLQN